MDDSDNKKQKYSLEYVLSMSDDEDINTKNDDDKNISNKKYKRVKECAFEDDFEDDKCFTTNKIVINGRNVLSEDEYLRREQANESVESNSTLPDIDPKLKNQIDFTLNVDKLNLQSYFQKFIDTNYKLRLVEAKILLDKFTKYVEILTTLHPLKKKINRIKNLNFNEAITKFKKFKEHMFEEDYRVLELLIFQDYMNNHDNDFCE